MTGLPRAFREPRTASRIDRDARMMRLELGFLEELRAEVADEAAQAPTDPDGFVAWFEGLEETGPGQHDPLFDWLETEADARRAALFLTQEAAGEAGFDDLVAMTQVKLPDRPKLELARNYWDEMGRGNPKGMHGPMLRLRGRGARSSSPSIETTCWESLALANAMTAMAANRDYAWHSVGALGVIELTAPARSAAVAAGHAAARLRRQAAPLLRSPRRARHQAQRGLEQGSDPPRWSRTGRGPARARAMAEGALMRLTCGERCFDRYRELLGVCPTRVAALVL